MTDRCLPSRPTGYRPRRDVLTRFNQEGAGMQDDDGGEALDDVARIHPVIDRLRELLTSATVLELKATARGYWAEPRPESGSGRPAEQPAD